MNKAEILMELKMAKDNQEEIFENLHISANTFPEMIDDEHEPMLIEGMKSSARSVHHAIFGLKRIINHFCLRWDWMDNGPIVIKAITLSFYDNAVAEKVDILQTYEYPYNEIPPELHEKIHLLTEFQLTRTFENDHPDDFVSRLQKLEVFLFENNPHHKSLYEWVQKTLDYLIF